MRELNLSARLMRYRPSRVPEIDQEVLVTQQEETALVGKLLTYMRALPRCHARKVHGSVYQDKGEPDVDACLDGRAVKVEVKTPDGGHPTPLQYKRMMTWEKAGALAGWVTSEAALVELLLHVGDRDWRNPQLDKAEVDRILGRTA